MARVDAAPAWIEGPAFDLLAFFGPALLALAAFAAVALANVSPLLMVWSWLVVFDGPHMLAAYSRAYGDPLLWQTKKPLLLGSLSAFLVGPALLVLGAWLAADWLFPLFLLLMTLYSYHHLVRQHWGFVALYAARSASPLPRAQRRALYLACWSPYGAFLVTHPTLRAFVGLELDSRAELFATFLAWALFAIWSFVLVNAVLLALRDLRGGRPPQSNAYLVAVSLFSGLLYFALARAEPLFGAAKNLEQAFMMLTVVVGVFHSAQYVALVALFHVRSGEGPEPVATWFGRSAFRTLLVLAPFLVLYIGVACATGLYPGSPAWLSSESEAPISASKLAIGVWWGFALQHYWLDERLWHVRSDARLRRILRLGSG